MRFSSSPVSRALTVLVFLIGSLARAIPTAAQTSSTDDGSSVMAASWAPAVSFEDQRAPYRRPAAKLPIGVRLFGAVDVEHMLAKQSFAATLGTSTLFGVGGGIDAVNLNGGGLFFRAAASLMGKSGTRSTGTISSGFALQVRMLPIDLGLGWRFNHATRANNVTPFVGGGALLLHYSETSPAGDSTDDISSWFIGFEAFGGVDVRLTPSLTVAPEVDFRSLPGAIGSGGLSQVFNESNLGGLAVRVTVGVRLGRR
jgi:opacity protein-like surface antigen